MRPLLLVVALTLGLAAASDPQNLAITRVFPQPGQLGLFIAAADGTGERALGDPLDSDYDAAFAPDGATIVFTSERGGSADLYRMRPDGGGVERLTDSPSYDDQGAFSPDGRQIVFVTTRADRTADLWLLDLASRRARPLTAGPGGDFRPSWSPDGQWVAFSSDRSSTLPFAHGRWEHLHVVDIYIVRPDGSGLKQVSEPGGFCGSPKWTADSQRVIAYCMTAEQTLDNRRAVPEHPEDTRIVAIDIRTGQASEVPSGPGVKFNPSPIAGGLVGYIRRDGEEAGIRYSNGKAGPTGQVRTASWSPDGTQVVFHRRIPFSRRPWVRTFSRHQDYDLTLTSGGPSFSPAGDRFAFVAPGEKAMGAGVGVAPAGGGEPRVIYRDPSRNVLGPQWSPDGERIIFGLGVFNAFFNGFRGLFLKPGDRTEGGAQIAIVNADGTGFRQLTSGANNNGFPSMSPDGRRFVYRTFGPDGEGLRVMEIDSNKTTTLSEGYDNFPLWSPRGDLIMFSRLADGDYEIYTMKPDGTAVTRLTRSKGNDAHMAWSPDGSRIAFASTRMGFKDEMSYTDAPQPYGEIFVMRSDGSDLQQLTDNQWEEGTPAWRPVRPSP
jgi:Tol biopolymer transport system component